jgi:hypothetical protein
MHKIMKGNAPPSLTNKCSANENRDISKLNIPLPRIDLYKSSLAYSGSLLWNSLSKPMKQHQHITKFKEHYFQSLLQ